MLACKACSSGALSAVSMASYKAVMSMALNGRHELLRRPATIPPLHPRTARALRTAADL